MLLVGVAGAWLGPGCVATYVWNRLEPKAMPSLEVPEGLPNLSAETCAACHTGEAAREEIRTSHPERVRCRQCHLERVTTREFVEATP